MNEQKEPICSNCRFKNKIFVYKGGRLLCKQIMAEPPEFDCPKRIIPKHKKMPTGCLNEGEKAILEMMRSKKK